MESLKFVFWRGNHYSNRPTTMRMGLADVFKLSIYALTAYVGVVLGAAEQGWIPFVSLPVTILGYYLCELKNRNKPNIESGLRETPARIMAFLALTACVFEFFGDNPEGKLLSGIHLVVFLTWVVLLQRKNDYRYWLLLALDVLQIAVGAVLTNSSWFGMSMIAYLFFAVWTLSVFTLYRAEREFLGTEPEAASNEQKAEFGDTLLGHAYNSVRFENGIQWVSMKLVGGTTATSLMGLCVGMLFFALIPRVWVGTEFGISDDVLPSSLRRKLGLANEVRLGEMRPILESNDPVLRIRLFDLQAKRQMNLQDYAQRLGYEAPCFRGAVLTEYKNGRWRTDRVSAFTDTERLAWGLDDPQIRETGPTVRQEIQLERIGNDVLLCMGRPIAMHDAEENRCGRMQPVIQLAIRRDHFKALPGTVSYTAYALLPSEAPRGSSGFATTGELRKEFRLSSHLKSCAEVPTQLTRLVDAARKIVDEEQTRLGQAPTDLEKARAIYTYLRHSGELKYSLSADTVDKTIDPIEDFLFNRHAGHCEYFASAMALMLRAVGIPCRLVAGFKGGEERPDSYFYVEKRFAHVWVEAWAGDKQWTILDPTPEMAREESVTQIGTRRNVWSAMTTQLAGIWESNVLDISYDRQESMLYRPMREWLTVVWERIRVIGKSPGAAAVEMARFMMSPRNWVTVEGLQIISFLAASTWLIRRKFPWIRSLWKRRTKEAAGSARNRVEFYDRFSRLMEAHGHHRQLAQTQGEFVNEVADDVSRMSEDQLLRGDLLPVSELFYHVRFGEGELSPLQESQLNELLTRLEKALTELHGHSRSHS